MFPPPTMPTVLWFRDREVNAPGPIAPLDVAPVAQDLAVQGDHHAQGQLGHRIGIDTRGVEDGNPPAVGGLDVDRIISGAPADDRLQTGLVGQNRLRCFQNPDHHTVHVGEGLILLLRRNGEEFLRWKEFLELFKSSDGIRTSQCDFHGYFTSLICAATWRIRSSEGDLRSTLEVSTIKWYRSTPQSWATALKVLIKEEWAPL